MLSKIDLSKPRRVIYQSFQGGPEPCPECGGRLHQSRQTYSVATRKGRREMDSFVMGSDFGWYCGSCPVVVINSLKVSKMLSHSMPHWEVGNEFLIHGLVDLEAVPEDKRHLPIGDPDNPVPLIPFHDGRKAAPRAPLTKKERQRRKKKLLGRKNKARTNKKVA